MDKIYQLYGIDTAMHLLRPGAKWEISNTMFTRWEDPRPCPTMEEVMETMEKIKAFEEMRMTSHWPCKVKLFAKTYGLDYSNISKKINLGWTVEKILKKSGHIK